MGRFRRACVPARFASPARVADGRLRCTVEYADADSRPIGATLLPVVASDRRWRLAAADGQPLCTPTAADLGAPILPLDAASIATEGIIEIDLPWPGDTTACALLLLLHDQIAGVGSDDEHPAADSASDSPAALIEALTRAPAATLDRGVVRHRQRAAATTADEPAAFALASCQFPAGLLDGSSRRTDWIPTLADAGPAAQSLFRLALQFEADPTLGLAVLCGDQVYVDMSAGLFDPGHLATPFEFAYQRLADNPGMQRLLRSGSEIVALIDDHEIVDNWEPLPKPADRDRNRKLLDNKALPMYLRHQRRMWPAPPDPPHRLWSERVVAGHAFFFADTRTERECRQLGNWRQARMISAAQRDALLAWIGAHAADRRPAFVVSPSIVLPRPLALQRGAAMALHVDPWSGWPASQHELLAHVCDSGASSLVFLSGDEHLSCVARIALRCEADPAREVVVHSVHSSALYAPYPFANASEADFAADETFSFEILRQDGSTRRYTCAVQTWFPRTGSGYAVLRTSAGAEGWRLDVEFEGTRGSVRRTLPSN